MKNLLSAFLLAGLLLTCFHSRARGQEAKSRDNNSAGPRQSESAARTIADETFELDISERRITRSNYSASTAVEINNQSASGISLRVGVAVSAGTIDVLLRGVAGVVRFRATLEPVLARIRARGYTVAPR